MNRHLVIVFLLVCMSAQGSQDLSNLQKRTLSRSASEGDCSSAHHNNLKSVQHLNKLEESRTHEAEDKLLYKTCTGIFLGSLFLGIVGIAGLMSHLHQTMTS